MKSFSLILTTLLLVVLPAHALSTVGEQQIAFDNNEDIEPAMVSQVRSNGIEYTITVNMKFNLTTAGGSSTLRSTLNMSNGGGSVTTIPSVTDYQFYGDPVLARDERTTGTQPVYLAGVARYTADPNNPNDRNRSAIAVWHTSDGGFNWVGHGVVAAELGRDPNNVNTAYNILDKPAIAVGPTGTIYVAYVQLHGEFAVDNQIMLTSSSDGGWTWSYPVEVAGSTRIHPVSGNAVPSLNHAPQVQVDSNGDVYVLWTRAADDAGAGIFGRVARASNPLVFNEDLPCILTGASSLYGSQNNPGQVPFRVTTSGGQTVTDYVRAVTVPTAKLDPATGRRRLAVTWHQRNDGGSSNIRFAALGLNTTYAGASWTVATFTRAGGFNLQPATDYSRADGKFLVTYYAFGGNDTYWQYANTVTFSGNTPVVGANTAITGVISDIDVYAPTVLNANQTLRYLGEYHDVSYSGTTFKSVGIVCVTTGNPWLWTITP